MPKVMISAAEVSGDVHASYLVREIKKLDPSIVFFGLGGERMKAAGVDVRLDITSRSTIGFIEVLKHIPSHLRSMNRLKKMMDEERPDALILVDAQGFNMPLASVARKKGIKTIYYIAPQEWLWGTENGIKKVAGTIDLIISIFRKEHEAYEKAGGKSLYFGHPLMDIARKTSDKNDFASKHGIDPSRKIISLCPGSRWQEIKGLSPILIATAKRIKDSIPDAQFIIPLSSSIYREAVKRMADTSGINIIVAEGDNYDVLGNSDLVIAASGTIVLESVVLDVPVIMLYKLALPTYLIARYILRIRMPYYSMPNILADMPIVPEYIMDEANPDNLSVQALRLLNDKALSEKMKKDFGLVMSKLGDHGVIRKTADAIVKFLHN